MSSELLETFLAGKRSARVARLTPLAGVASPCSLISPLECVGIACEQASPVPAALAAF
jgi:hypothetical protein